MGAGGENSAPDVRRRGGVHFHHDGCNGGWLVEEDEASDGRRDLRRLERREPTGKPLRRRTSSLERIGELADWKRIGLHDKYADETMVRGGGRGRMEPPLDDPGFTPNRSIEKITAIALAGALNATGSRAVCRRHHSPSHDRGHAIGDDPTRGVDR